MRETAPAFKLPPLRLVRSWYPQAPSLPQRAAFDASLLDGSPRAFEAGLLAAYGVRPAVKRPDLAGLEELTPEPAEDFVGVQVPRTPLERCDQSPQRTLTNSARGRYRSPVSILWRTCICGASQE